MSPVIRPDNPARCCQHLACVPRVFTLHTLLHLPHLHLHLGHILPISCSFSPVLCVVVAFIMSLLTYTLFLRCLDVTTNTAKENYTCFTLGFIFINNLFFFTDSLLGVPSLTIYLYTHASFFTCFVITTNSKNYIRFTSHASFGVHGFCSPSFCLLLLRSFSAYLHQQHCALCVFA